MGLSVQGHVLHVFLFHCFDIQNLANPGGSVPSRARQFLEIITDLPVSPSFLCKPTNPKITPPVTSSIRLSPSGPLSTYLHPPGPGTRQPSFYGPAKACWNYPNLSPIGPFSSHRNDSKGSCSHFPLIPSASSRNLVLPCVAPLWRGEPVGNHE